MLLHHRPQRHLYGCIYHALYAITGTEEWLTHVADISQPRWLARVHASEYTLLTYFADLVGELVTPPDFWAGFRELMREADHTHQPLLVTIAGRGGFGRHLVALALPRPGQDIVQVSDSACPGLLHLTYDEFLSSEYARAHEVQALTPAALDLYPFQSGAEYVSQTDTSPYLM